MYSKNFVLDFTKYSFYFFPISFILGSLAINFNVIIFIICSLYYIKKKKIKLEFNFLNKLLFSFFLLIILSSAINYKIIGLENLVKSILLLRFFLIYILLEKLLIKKEINLNIFFKICFFTTLFISLDLLLQFYSGKNIFGFKPHDGRIAGIFGAEAIAGSFLQKFFLFSLIGCLLISKKKLNIIEILFYLITISGIFVSSNRISFIIIFFILLILLFLKFFRKKILLVIFLLLPFLILTISTNQNIKSKFNDLQIKFIGSAKIFLDKNELYKGNYSINHGRIYYSSIQTFKQNYIIGGGLKSFRYKCFLLKKENISCSTHPHNYHLEILNDVGTVGFIILLLFVLYVLKEKLIFLRNETFKKNEKIILTLILLNFCIEIFPLKSTGSMFSTWTGTLLWLSIAIINYGKKTNRF